MKLIKQSNGQLWNPDELELIREIMERLAAEMTIPASLAPEGRRTTRADFDGYQIEIDANSAGIQSAINRLHALAPARFVPTVYLLLATLRAEGAALVDPDMQPIQLGDQSASTQANDNA